MRANMRCSMARSRIVRLPVAGKSRTLILKDHNDSGRTAVEFELKYTPEQEKFRSEVRAWLAANVPAGMNRSPKTWEESKELYTQRRALGRKLGAKGWLYPSGDKKYGGGGLGFDQIIVLEEESA